MGWFSKLLVIGVVGFGGYVAYDWNRGGYFSLPDIPTGAYPISFKSGLRGVVYDMDVTDDQYADAPKIFRRLVMANRDRRFLGLSSDVPRWFEDTWSTCRAGAEDEREYIVSTMPEDMKRELVGARLDAICYIEIEGESPNTSRIDLFDSGVVDRRPYRHSACRALLHKASDVRGSPFPGRIHPTVSVTGMPSAV